MLAEEPPTMDFAGILERELQYVGRFCEMAKVACAGDSVIEQALTKAAEGWDLSDHLRFVPAGVGLPQLYCFLHDFNQKQEAAGLPILKICQEGDHKPGKEWWRSRTDVHEPTIAGVSYLDHGMVMRPTDLAGRPFNLPSDLQHAWALERRGDGLTSAEGTLYHFSRSILEEDRPLWGSGLVRCRNAYGSGYSIDVDWDAIDGLSVVDHWHRTDTYWNLGALPWRFIRA
ncbi:hypothetical protein KJ713_03340 [Patescibacteria group bacterium]|nr:hypothetical protein [Patescibacteria group bacterium]